jgi:hypothetical protein
LLGIVVIREEISEIIARLKDFFQLFRKRELNPISLAEISRIFSKYAGTRTSNPRNIVFLDNFPIYRWAIPNILLAHQIAGEMNANVAVFSFRLPNRTSRLFYKKVFVDEVIQIKLNRTQQKHLISEYRQLIDYLESNRPLIDYKISEIAIGLDIYESILRSGRPKIDLFDQQTYRIAYLGLKQFIYFRTLFEEGRIKSILVSHDNYIGPGLLAHMAFHFKVEVILANLHSMNIPEKAFQLYEKFDRYQIYIENLSDQEIEKGTAWAREELSKRTHGILGIGIKYQSKSAFTNVNIARQTSYNTCTKILVLTHDFFDNPHAYARMTFDNFLMWMEFLADISLETNYEWYIKPHRDFSGIELEILGSFLNSNKNFYMIDPETSFHQLKSEGIEFALTCYGSVGHELPLLGFTVINASYNPHSAFNFNVTAKSQNDYERILKNITDYRLSNINNDEIYKFYYIHHRIVQSDCFMGVSVEDLDDISKGKLNSNLELDYLLSHVGLIAENAIKHLRSMRATRRVYGFEEFLRPELQLKRLDAPKSAENC